MAAFHSNVPLALEPAVVYSLKGDHGYLFCPGTKDNVYIDRNSTKLFNTLWKDLVLGSKINVTTTNTASAAEKNAELIADMLVVCWDWFGFWEELIFGIGDVGGRESETWEEDGKYQGYVTQESTGREFQIEQMTDWWDLRREKVHFMALPLDPKQIDSDRPTIFNLHKTNGNCEKEHIAHKIIHHWCQEDSASGTSKVSASGSSASGTTKALASGTKK